jgi:hypothetical protein
MSYDYYAATAPILKYKIGDIMALPSSPGEVFTIIGVNNQSSLDGRQIVDDYFFIDGNPDWQKVGEVQTTEPTTTEETIPVKTASSGSKAGWIIGGLAALLVIIGVAAKKKK